MMQTLRNPKVLKMGLWVILILTIPSFVAFYGFSQSSGSSGGSGKGQVFGVVHPPEGRKIEITKNELQAARASYVRDYEFLYQLMGFPGFDQATHSAFERSLSNREWLDYAVSEAALRHLAREHNIYVSDKQVTDQIRKEFGTADRLNTYLRRERITEPELVARVRAHLLDVRSEELISSAARSSVLELWQEYRIQYDLAKVTYAVVPSDRFIQDVEVTDAELRQYFEENKDQYTKPAERIYRYVMVQAPQLTPVVDPTEAQLRARYEAADPAQDQRYAQEPGVKFHQIMLEVNDGETPESVQQQLAQIRTEITGDNFEILADRYTEDENNIQPTDDGPILRGGEVTGLLTATSTPRFIDYYGDPWVNTATSLEVGDVSEPFESKGRFYILKAVRRNEGKITFEQARPLLQAEMRKESRDAEIAQRNEYIANKQQDIREIVATRTSIESIAEALGEQVRETSPTLTTQMSFPGIGNLASSWETIRDLDEGEISPVIRAGGTENLVVLKVEKAIPQRPQTFDEVAKEVERIVKTKKASERAKELAQQIAERVRSGDSLTSAAMELQLEVQTTDEFALSAAPPDIEYNAELINFIFRSEPGAVTTANRTLGISDHIVLQLVEKTVPSREEFIQNMQGVERQLILPKRAGILSDFRRSVVPTMNPEYDEDFVQESENRGRRRRS